MINFSFNGIKNSMFSFTFFNFSITSGNEKKPEVQRVENIAEEPCRLSENEPSPKEFTDYKTTLCRWDIKLIDEVEDDVTLYLFIQKRTEKISSWNLITPVVLENTTGKISQFDSGCFALQGSGGGLSNTRLLMYYLQLHREKGFKVYVVPKVVDNQLLDSFEYTDSGTTLSDILHNSTDLINYQKNQFKWIYKQYLYLIEKI
ncbi:MAG: hypothetical protein WBA74_25395 [Cyclobacteriaceae bacterium]